MKSMARFTGLLLALIGISGWALSQAYDTAAERQALIISAILAATVQVMTFGLIKLLGRQNMLIGWVLGAIFRGTILALYGIVLVKLFGLPQVAALVSFAVFLFVSMLLESTLLAYESRQ
jgi:hypothetical protein